MNLTTLRHTHLSRKIEHWPRYTAITGMALCCNLLSVPAAWAAERNTYQNNGITFSISVRTPDQIRAFYTGRGFPEAAIRELESRCLLTVGIQNNRQDIAWLEPSNWQLITEHGARVARVSRDELAARWEALHIPLASRATFGWTQLPESRDLYPGETAGGNIVVVPPGEAFTVTVRFATGTDKQGTPVTLQSSPLTCTDLPEAQK
ncbi:hypothetical protein [Sulfuriferula thiophila]|uniref:hypothetical protein n=1 Tax=Sulfuriferula thiophila TaxID=1781211 RepID=UPI000F604D5F|nr:hypothetical protein [Sulfuriferula thiophila]